VRFTVTLEDAGGGRLWVPIPFDPEQIWGHKPRHRVGGTVGDHRIRGILDQRDGAWKLLLTIMWLCDSGLTAGAAVEVAIEPEGPQRDDLAPDVVAALEANPEAAEFFDGLAQFYRKGYLRWIDSTKRSPAERVRRIAQTVELLAAGVKDYRQSSH
jgi:hypothetical protein